MSKAVVMAADLPAGDSEGRILFFVSSSNSPTSLFSYDLTTNKTASLVQGLNPNSNPADLVTGQVIRYKLFDSTEIPPLLFKRLFRIHYLYGNRSFCHPEA